MATEVLSGYLAPVEAARRLRLAEGTLRYYARLGRLPVVLAGGRPLYRVEDVDRFARERAERGNGNV